MAARVHNISDEDLMALARERFGSSVLHSLAKETKADEDAQAEREAYTYKKQLEDYCLKTYKLPLQRIFLASDPSGVKKPKEWKNDKTGETWKAGGKSNSKPDWVKALEKDWKKRNTKNAKTN